MKYMNNYVNISINPNKLQTLGLACKANKILSGDLIYKYFDKIVVLFIANDASIKTKERLIKKAFFYQIPVIEQFNSLELSNAIGKSNRMAVGLIDKNIYQSMLK